jgi:hypothetical protein
MVITRSSSKVVNNQEALKCPKPYTCSQQSLHSSGGKVVGCQPKNQVQGQLQKKEVSSEIKIGPSKSQPKVFLLKSIVHHTKAHTPILGSSLVSTEKKNLPSLNVNWVSLSPSGSFPHEDPHQVIYHTAHTPSPGSVSNNLSESSGLPSLFPFY